MTPRAAPILIASTLALALPAAAIGLWLLLLRLP